MRTTMSDDASGPDKLFSELYTTSPSPGHRAVWLFARPLRSSFFDWLTRGNFVLNHWGLLVSDLSPVDMEITLQRSFKTGRNRQGAWEANLGTMYDLYRTSEGKSAVQTRNQFRPPRSSFAFQFVATTNLGDEEIFELGFAPLNCG
jgi:hypothetical protein